MRGESRLCRGSIEPLRRLPDGALATRRIVSFLLRCCCGGAAQSCGRVRRARRSCVRRAARKGVPPQQSCVGGSQAALGADWLYRDANE